MCIFTYYGLLALLWSPIVIASEAKLHCATKDLQAMPYFTFDFTFKSGGNKPALGNSAKVSIEAKKSESYDAEKSQPEALSACTDLSVQLNLEKSEYKIRCGADGDAGEASLVIISNSGVAYGETKFREGKDVLGFRIPEDSKFGLVCRFIK